MAVTHLCMFTDLQVLHRRLRRRRQQRQQEREQHRQALLDEFDADGDGTLELMLPSRSMTELGLHRFTNGSPELAGSLPS